MRLGKRSVKWLLWTEVYLLVSGEDTGYGRRQKPVTRAARVEKCILWRGERDRRELATRGKRRVASPSVNCTFASARYQSLTNP